MLSEKINSVINIIDYKLHVYLGVNVKEKQLKQAILISVKIHLQMIPKAIVTDNINDTLCYHGVCNKLENFNNNSYTTVEYLCGQIYFSLHKIIKPNKLQLEIKKFPIINNLKGGVKFLLSNNAVTDH